MDTVTISRTGDAPLRFTGEMIAEADGQSVNRKTNRWYEIVIYKTSDSQYVVSVGYRSQWEGEQQQDYAYVCDSPTQVRHVLRSHEPIQGRIGFPPSPQYEDRQAKLEAELCGQFDTLVSKVLTGEEFAEVLGSCEYSPAMDAEFVGNYVRFVLEDFPLSHAEASALCDANNGALLLDYDWQMLAANVMDFPAKSLGEKWDCDCEALAKRLHAASRETKFALAWACAQFWRTTDLPTEEALEKAGFCIKGGE